MQHYLEDRRDTVQQLRVWCNCLLGNETLPWEACEYFVNCFQTAHPQATEDDWQEDAVDLLPVLVVDPTQTFERV